MAESPHRLPHVPTALRVNIALSRISRLHGVYLAILLGNRFSSARQANPNVLGMSAYTGSCTLLRMADPTQRPLQRPVPEHVVEAEGPAEVSKLGVSKATPLTHPHLVPPCKAWLGTQILACQLGGTTPEFHPPVPSLPVLHLVLRHKTYELQDCQCQT